MTKVAWADVKSIGKLPTDTYVAYLSGYDCTKLSKAGNKKATLEFTIAENPEFEGQKVFQDYSLLPQSLWGLMNVMIAMGKTEEELKVDERELEDQLNECRGVQVNIDVELYEWEGKPQNKVTGVRSKTAWG